MTKLDADTIEAIRKIKVAEYTESQIYRNLAGMEKKVHNKECLMRISADEMSHFQKWCLHVPGEVKPDSFKIMKYSLIAKVLGLTFAIKLMERNEKAAILDYSLISKVVPEAEKIQAEEEAHEMELINMIDEERLKYIGSIVLGLN
ncbi:MAG: rubrerythrin family protein, partial [Oligoflexales bacterium]|nr:rubrerythrin family protein [Oligoflexales bacterium]